MTVDTKVQSRYGELVSSLVGWSCTASNLVLQAEMTRVVKEKEQGVEYETRDNADSGVS
jgi:hypothetical protein